jgi:hypothetical protein
MVVQGHDRPVPDIRMDVETAAAVTPEAHEPLRCHIVPRHCKWHDKALAMQWTEQLSAIRVIIGAPDQRASTRFRRTVSCRLFRPVAPAKKVAVTDSIVPSVEGLACPSEFENSFGNAALIARILVDRSPALSRPPDDLDGEALWRVDEASIPLKGAIARHNNWCLMDPPHACRRYISDLSGINIHDDSRSVDRLDESTRRRPTSSPVFLTRGVRGAAPKAARQQSP